MADQHHHGSDPLVGRLFNDYVIEEQLARGVMGAVYLCRHQELPISKQMQPGGPATAWNGPLGTDPAQRRIARRWTSSSPEDETLRGTATTVAWRAAFSGAWNAASGSWPAAASGAWTSGAWPGATSGSWPAGASIEPSSSPVPAAVVSAEPSSLPVPAMPTVWKLVLLATVAAVLACLAVYALVRALEGR